MRIQIVFSLLLLMTTVLGIQGIKPVDWVEASPGGFARSSSALDVAVLIEQAATTSADNLLALLTRQLALEETPVSVGSREANALAWELYATTTRGVHVDFALATCDGQALMVLLQSMPTERDALYQSVFLPALDALTLSD
jgi:hypothetical protein